MNSGLLFPMIFLYFLHFKMKQVQPLLMQTVTGVMNMVYSPLFQVYVLGRNLERPFKMTSSVGGGNNPLMEALQKEEESGGGSSSGEQGVEEEEDAGVDDAEEEEEEGSEGESDDEGGDESEYDTDEE